MNSISTAGWGLCLLTTLTIGCGAPEFAPVSGVVTYQGAPLSGATVSFSPLDGSKFSYAVTGSDGTFELAVAGRPDQPGAKVGEHRVKVTAISESKVKQQSDPTLGSLFEPGGAPKISYLIPPKYDNYETSGLTFTVTSSGSQEANFSLGE